MKVYRFQVQGTRLAIIEGNVKTLEDGSRMVVYPNLFGIDQTHPLDGWHSTKKEAVEAFAQQLYRDIEEFRKLL